MTDPLILHIETATDICSVAISEGGQTLALVESGPERSHATLLNRFIREAMAQAGKELSQLDAIAVSKGPGSYTGLRIGVSTAKGLAYALEKPLLACGTLENMAYAAMNHPAVRELVQTFENSLLLCPMLDARRMEVEWETVSPRETRRFRVVARRTSDLFSEIEGAIRKFKGSLIEGRIEENDDGRLEAQFTVELDRSDDFKKVMKSIRTIPQVLNIAPAELTSHESM